MLVNGVSKTYAMTGWRIGFTAGDARVIKAMSTLQGQSTSNPTSIAQVAATTAFLAPRTIVHDMVGEFRRRMEKEFAACLASDEYRAAMELLRAEQRRP